MRRLLPCSSSWLSFLFVTVVVSQCPSDGEDGGLAFDARWGSCQKLLQGGGAISKDVYLYGRFESRLQAINCSGVLVSFFLYNPKSEDDSNGWQEIDVEVFGKDDAATLQTNIIGGVDGNRTLSQQLHHSPDGMSFAERLHTFAIEWTPEYVRWLVDGTEIRYVSDGDDDVSVPSRPMELHQSVWVVHPYIEDWGGAFDDKSCALPARAEFDWVRVWDYDLQTRAFTPAYEEHFSKDGKVLEAWKGGDWVLVESSFLLSRSDFSKSTVRQEGGRLTIALRHSDMTTLPDPYGRDFCYEKATRYQPSAGGELTVPIRNPVLGDLGYPSFPISSAKDCQRTCQAHPRCRHFSFTEPHTCRVFSHIQADKTQQHHNSTAGPRYCVHWCFADEKDHSSLSRGGALWSESAETFKECQQWCTGDGRCGGVVYDMRTTTCSLKGWSTHQLADDEYNRTTHHGIGITHTRDRRPIMASRKIACGWPLPNDKLPAVFRENSKTHHVVLPVLVGAIGAALFLLLLLWLLRSYYVWKEGGPFLCWGPVPHHLRNKHGTSPMKALISPIGRQPGPGRTRHTDNHGEGRRVATSKRPPRCAHPPPAPEEAGVPPSHRSTGSADETGRATEEEPEAPPSAGDRTQTSLGPSMSLMTTTPSSGETGDASPVPAIISMDTHRRSVAVVKEQEDAHTPEATKAAPPTGSSRAWRPWSMSSTPVSTPNPLAVWLASRSKSRPPERSRPQANGAATSPSTDLPVSPYTRQQYRSKTNPGRLEQPSTEEEEQVEQHDPTPIKVDPPKPSPNPDDEQAAPVDGVPGERDRQGHGDGDGGGEVHPMTPAGLNSEGLKAVVRALTRGKKHRSTGERKSEREK
ncbi:unnamed protein product [Vitrella brassicaformis CCMP3155]|uniref:GH16 domain-containing protein n=1 Tax=Vitrella brassicaformis (strain CCMP3155) TaxID=1169540 RepID=A0A0G4ELW9_VITBC|nr:unnamed protein product [Vitrella brassicaformis CCMP3155]|eukprot:CEL98418.1 unnamed protein product [Vitrella brassicaformis CCMP3155]